MALLNNIGSLVVMLMQPNQHQESQQLANRAGVDTNDFAKIAALGLPLLLQGMNRNNQSKEGLESFNQALNQHQTRNNYDSLNQFTQNVDPDDGEKIVNHVFSGDKDNVSSGLAQRLGVSPQTVQRTLAVLAPLVLKYLADRKRDQNLSAQDIQNETQNATQEVAQQVREYNKADAPNRGLLGDLFSNLTDDNKSEPTKSQEKDYGLLGDLFNLFK